ncbi:MAG: hypothetical protein GY719_27805 [bacterium]|nr:hypothetical protein [bacterium]
MRALIAALVLGAMLPSIATARTEKFFVDIPDNALALTTGPGNFLAGLPAGIGLLDDPAIQNGLAALAKVSDENGDVIGFASELIDIDFVQQVTATDWTVVIPGRGTLFLTTAEDVAPLLAIVEDMVATGELERVFDPPLVNVNTVPGTGFIVGGTGEFEGAEGTFREIDIVFSLSLITGELVVTDILEVNFDDDDDDESDSDSDSD